MENLEAKNYFEIFNLPVLCEIDAEQLRGAYLKLQQEYHPDKFLLAIDADKDQAQKNSRFINKAYSTLAHPVELMQYLLSLKGYSLTERFATALDDDFLEQVFEWQGAMLDLSEVEATKREIKKYRDNLFLSASSLLKEERYAEAFEVFKKIKFVDRLLV